MNKEDKKLQENLVNEMMKVSKTNPNVMIYMQSLMKCYEDLENENQQLKENYDRIYNENCKLREEHNITDISLLDENYKLKKQKDDVVELIKQTPFLYSPFKQGVLRMLGEIDEENIN